MSGHLPACDLRSETPALAHARRLACEPDRAASFAGEPDRAVIVALDALERDPLSRAARAVVADVLRAHLREQARPCGPRAVVPARVCRLVREPDRVASVALDVLDCNPLSAAARRTPARLRRMYVADRGVRSETVARQRCLSEGIV
jgi:hypothetical protein